MKKISLFMLMLLFITAILPLTQAQAATYSVKSGDTLWGISQEFGIPVEIISQDNDINNSGNLYIGQKLIIRSEGNKIIITIGNGNNSNNYSSYTVKSGDTLWKIAQKFDTSIEKIIALNDNIESNYALYIGQQILIPGQNNGDNNNGNNDNSNNDGVNDRPSTRYRYYYVQGGDILWTIAQRYNVSVQDLVEWNNIQNAYDLYVGRRLIVGVEEETVDPATPNNPNNLYSPYYFYQVKEGDQIWGIAEYFGVRTSRLIQFNNIEDINKIQVGDIIIIPLTESNKLSYLKNASAKLNNFYRVRGNETLAEIAEYFAVPEAGIRAINQLNQDEQIYTGQRLLMPVSSALFKKHQLYTVKNGGEYIYNIAYQKGVSIKSILKANYFKNLNMKFSAGTVIVIPLDEESKTTWIDYEDGKPVNSTWY